MKTLYLLLSLNLSLNLNAQNWLWAKNIGQDLCSSISGITDSKGFIYTAIHCGNSYTTNSSFCNYTPIFAKHDSLGNVIWVQSCTQGLATVFDMDVDGLDNLYVTGNIAGTSTLCGGTNSNVVITASPSQQWSFIAKYSEQGALQWIYLWDYPNIPTSGLEIETDRLGYSFVTGYGYSNYNGSVTYIEKFGPTGMHLWDQSYAQYNPFVITDLDLDGLDNCYITGYFLDSLEINQVKLYANTPACNICATSFMAKLDGNGTVIWLKKLGGNDVYSLSINLDHHGNFLVSGYCNNSFSAGSYTLNAGGFVAKFDTSGNNLWALHQKPKASYAVTDNLGNYYVTGKFLGHSATFGTNSNSLTITSSRSNELFLTKYDAQGNPAWAISPIPGSTYGYNDPQQLICDNNNRLYLLGGFAGTSIFGNSTLTNTYTILSSLDAFIARVAGYSPLITDLDNMRTNDWKLFPNPVTEFLIISPDGRTSEMLQIAIRDVTNKIVFQSLISRSQNSEIDVSHLSPGIYILHIEGKNTSIRKKLSKI